MLFPLLVYYAVNSEPSLTVPQDDESSSDHDESSPLLEMHVQGEKLPVYYSLSLCGI